MQNLLWHILIFLRLIYLGVGGLTHLFSQVWLIIGDSCFARTTALPLLDVVFYSQTLLARLCNLWLHLSRLLIRTLNSLLLRLLILRTNLCIVLYVLVLRF